MPPFAGSNPAAPAIQPVLWSKRTKALCRLQQPEQCGNIGCMGHYLTACICLNGHVITDSVEKGFGTPHCSSCGEKTVTSCSACSSNIRGDYETPGVAFLGGGYSPAPTYCHGCGGAYPWTQRKLDGIAELAAAMDELTDYERAILVDLMPHIVEETARTPAAGFKIAAIVQRLTGPAKKVLTDAIVAIAVEAGKQALGVK